MRVIKDDEGADFYSFSIITVPPNKMLRSLPHHRMPAILKNEHIEKWLDRKQNPLQFVNTTEDELMEFNIEEMHAKK